MSVDVPRILSTFGTSVMMGELLEASNDYQLRSNFTLGTLLVFASVEWDTTADRLVTENARMETIFRDAVDALRDDALADRLREASAAGVVDLKISTLRARNDALRGLLIELHAHIEELDSPEARRVEREIWEELVASTDRRVLPGAPF